MATALETKITRIANNVTAALAKIAEKGVTVPSGSNSDNLESLIGAISGGGGRYCWRKYSFEETYSAKMIGISQPSDMAYTAYKSYVITEDGYFQLSGSTYSNGYYLPAGATNGKTKKIYKKTLGVTTTYQQLTIESTITKGDLEGYVVSGTSDAYPSDGDGGDGYWYTADGGSVCSVTFEYDESTCAVNRAVFTQVSNGSMQTATPDIENGTVVSDIACGSFAYLYVTGAGTGQVDIPDEMEVIQNFYYDNGYIHLIKMPSTPEDYTLRCYTE